MFDIVLNELVLPKDEYFIATYQVTSKTNLYDAAWNIAVGQSFGNPGENARNDFETQELIENHCAKIVIPFLNRLKNSITLCINLDDNLDDINHLKTSKVGKVMIAFPVRNINWATDGFTQLLCTLIGGNVDIDIISECRLIDIEFPKKILDSFPKPYFGISGMREITGVYDKPLLGSIIKPKTGLSVSQLLDMVKMLVDGGVNFIKEDEILGNPDCCPLYERIEVIGKYLDNNANIVYCACINGTHNTYPIRLSRNSMYWGVNGVHLNFWAGLDSYREVRKIDQYISKNLFIHFQQSGSKILTDPRNPYGIDEKLYYYLAGLAGCDSIHCGMIGGYSSHDEKKVVGIVQKLQSINSVPALSCGMHPGLVDYVVSKVGNDVLLNAGGAIHAHPGGTKAGAKAMRQAIDGNYDFEYGQAIRKFGYKNA